VIERRSDFEWDLVAAELLALYDDLVP